MKTFKVESQKGQPGARVGIKNMDFGCSCVSMTFETVSRKANVQKAGKTIRILKTSAFQKLEEEGKPT